MTGQTLNVAAPGALAGATDPDGDQLSASLVTGPANGGLTLYPDGSFAYIPNAGFVGQDTFSYEALDGVSNSNVATVTINVSQAATTTTLTASPNPSVYGQTVVFTATVAVVSPGTGLPTGTVTFTIDGTNVATTSLNSSAQATYSTSTLTVGIHTVTASYSGNSSFNSSVSSPLSQTVGQPQLLAGVPKAAAGGSLTVVQLQPVIAQAIAQLQAAGYNVSGLNLVNFQVASLSPGLLGVTYRDNVWIDGRGDGYGWYVGSMGAVFGQASGAREWAAKPGNPAFGHIDLLTVVTHELGHVLGFASINPAVAGHDWMTATLGAGIRRLPDALLSAGLVAAPPPHQRAPALTAAPPVVDARTPLFAQDSLPFTGVPLSVPATWGPPLAAAAYDLYHLIAMGGSDDVLVAGEGDGILLGSEGKAFLIGGVV